MFVQCAFLCLLCWKMEEVDPEGALKMYVDTKDWDKCLELASKQVLRVCTVFFHTHVQVCVHAVF